MNKEGEMVKNVLIDLDDTLFDFHAAEKRAISTTLGEMQLPTDEGVLSLYSRINKECWEKLERGEWSREEVLVGRFKLLFGALGVERDPMAARKRYEALLGIGHIFIDGAVELLEELCGRYRLYLVSNGTERVQKGRIASSGIEKYFDGIFISECLGVNKPDERFFDAVFGTIDGFEKSETVIIGDSPSSDILGGIRSGIRTIRFNPKAVPDRVGIIPDYTVKSLAEIPLLLSKI